MPGDIVDAPLEEAGGESYAEQMRAVMKAIDYYSKELRTAYIFGREAREAHYNLISLCVLAWEQLIPKVMNKPELSKQLKKWMFVQQEPRILLNPKYEKLIFLFAMHIRIGFEHLGLLTIE